MCIGDIKREELEKTCKKIHKVWAIMVAAYMVLVLGTAGAAPARRAAEGCKPPRVFPDNVAF